MFGLEVPTEVVVALMLSGFTIGGAVVSLILRQLFKLTEAVTILVTKVAALEHDVDKLS